MRHWFGSVCMAMAASAAFGQSFNIDINQASGVGAGIPSSTYGAAAGQPGTWNNINSSTATTSTLLGLNGAATSVTFTRSTVGTIQGTTDGDITSSDYAKLVEDYQRSSSSDMYFTFNNLAAGTYALYTYGVTPANTQRASVIVSGASGSSFWYVGGAITGNNYVPGLTHSIHVKSVLAGGSLQVQIVGSGTFGAGTVGGFQLVKIDNSRIRFLVDDSVAGNYDGTTWATALPDVQMALNAASQMGGNSVEIWVAQGFYYPTSGTDRTISFVVPSGLHFYGGFAATETSLSQRTAPWFYITALSGAIGGSSQSDNTYHVVVADNTSTGTIIDGFSIARGNANGSGNDDTGGGLTITNGSPRIENCKFLSNWASGDAGGVYTTIGNPVFVNCLFYNNDCTNGTGGGVMAATAGMPTFWNCEFLGNHAIGDGGAVKLLYSPGVFVGCLFSGNTTSFDNGGAVSVGGDDTDDANFTNCTFSLNASGQACGGVYASTGADLFLKNCILWGNTDSVGSPLQDQQVYAVNAHGSFLVALTTTIQGAAGALNPLFVNPLGGDGVAGTSDDDCHLQAGSPCIDAGNNNLIPLDSDDIDGDGNTSELMPIDLDGNPRRMDVASVPDTGTGTAPIIDRGAYEYPGTPPVCHGDANCDGQVNFADIDYFVAAIPDNQAAWAALYAARHGGQQPTCNFLNNDITGDGHVNFSDIDPFVALIPSVCP